VVVCDFGIATIEEQTGLTVAGQACGTPDYMAPEQARGESVGPAADVYACGVLLFRLLTGELPFTRATPLATAIAHLTDPIPSACERLPFDLTPYVDAVLERLLAKDPNDRPEDGEELAAFLRAVDLTRAAPRRALSLP
jgi:eukaryotic-like serine/threonine-protein kinase